MSTVPPGRKICTNGTEDNESTDGMVDINDDTVNHPHKNEEKRQNGNKEEHNEVNSTEHIPEGGESSSSQVLSEGVKKEESTKVEPEVSEKSADAEQPTVSSEPKTETETVTAEVAPKAEKDEVKPVEVVEKAVEKAVEKVVEKAATVKEETIIPKSEETEKIDKDEKMIEPTESVKIETEVKKEEKIESTTPAPLKDEVKPEKEEIKETTPIEIEKPPTPKRRNDDEEEGGDVVSNGSSAKKIRLEMDDDEEKEEVKSATEVKEATTSQPESANEPVAKSEVDLPKETDILESISTEIDAQKENELLEDVVDSTLITEKDPINIDVKPIDDSVVDKVVPKQVEEIPTATEDLLKTDEPVAIPSDLDFTPDEALNELVSSDILAAIPEQPAVEEIKMSEESDNVVAEPVVAPAVEMNVENTETNTAETENAMESAPIKGDEEQMDVDESNSVDAMDL